MRYLLIIFILLSFYFAKGQHHQQKVAQYLDSLMQYGVENNLIPGAILSVVSEDSIYLSKGYGFSDIKRNIPVDPDKSLFQLASLGKIFTSISVLQEVQDNRLSLNTDINEYLTGWGIENQYSTPVTLERLLTHTAGFDDRVIGYLARSEFELANLEKHLKTNMPGLFQEPGKSINYSNYSYALAGHLVELSSGISFQDYVKQNILDPLGMNRSTYYLPDNYQEMEEYAHGYQLRDEFEEIHTYPRYALPAGSILSTAGDMSIFLKALIKRDSIIIRDEFYKKLFNEQFTNHTELSGYSLGFEIQQFSTETVYGKGGVSPGFLSYLIVFPESDLGLFVSINTETDNFMDKLMTGFRSEFFATENTDPVFMEIDNYSEYSGHYQNDRANHHTIEEMFAMFQDVFEVWQTRDTLRAYHNGSIQSYLPTGDDVFSHINNPGWKLVFERGSNGKVQYLYRNVDLGGFQVPASYSKLGRFERPRFLNDEYPFILIVIVSYILLPMIWVLVYFIRKKRANFMVSMKLPLRDHFAAFIFLLFFFWNIVGFFIPLLQNPEMLFFGLDDSLLNIKYVNWLMAASVVVLIILSVKQWTSKSGSTISRVYYSVFTLSALSHIAVLLRWHFFNVEIL